ncbi:hypothetical protein MANES_01G043450v8 [Manihot esculenta]|uniref:Uncharacterized protein n=1 Tax=Manihot esculenta TaxID=3983 RepID=A0ACB7IAG5_MANES|nr:hypothetical protein MANES_01G043450v8 [Manihot esculenta]
MFIIVYYTKLKKLWDKSACLRPVSTCNCGASKQLVEIKSDDRLMQFLMGLNGAYDHVKNQLLLMDPLPNIDKAYSMMLRVEKQREVNSIVIDCIESSIAMQVQGPNYKKEGERNQYKKKDDRYCSHYKNIGHTNETCFKLHDNPEWYKQKKNKYSRNMENGDAEDSHEAESSNTANNNESRNENLANLVHQEVMRIMKGKMVNEAGCVEFTGFAVISEFPYNVFTQTDIVDNMTSQSTWIIDSGATSHMCLVNNLFSS